MPRHEQLLYPSFATSDPLAAASLILVRDNEAGQLEVLMSRRSSRASFAPNVYVFPGGHVDSEDAVFMRFLEENHGKTGVNSDAGILARGLWRSDQHDPMLRQFALAALRECFEEMGLLLASQNHKASKPCGNELGYLHGKSSEELGKIKKYTDEPLKNNDFKEKVYENHDFISNNELKPWLDWRDEAMQQQGEHWYTYIMRTARANAHENGSTGKAAWQAQLSKQKLCLRTDCLWPFSRLMGGRNLPKRFDTIFFVALAPAGQKVQVDGKEQLDAMWVMPKQALDWHENGKFALIYPTRRLLERLSTFKNAQNIINYCKNDEHLNKHSHFQTFPFVCPRAGLKSALGQALLAPPKGDWLENTSSTSIALGMTRQDMSVGLSVQSPSVAEAARQEEKGSLEQAHSLFAWLKTLKRPFHPPHPDMWHYAKEDVPYGELALVCPQGQPLHRLNWQSNFAVPLLKGVKRLTCQNPSVMTGPGTNTYCVGDEYTGFVVIDPGPYPALAVGSAHGQEGGKNTTFGVACSAAAPNALANEGEPSETDDYAQALHTHEGMSDEQAHVAQKLHVWRILASCVAHTESFGFKTGNNAGNLEEKPSLEPCFIDIRAIVCTHSHPDHAPAAWMVQAACATLNAWAKVHLQNLWQAVLCHRTGLEESFEEGMGENCDDFKNYVKNLERNDKILAKIWSYLWAHAQRIHNIHANFEKVLSESADEIKTVMAFLAKVERQAAFDKQVVQQQALHAQTHDAVRLTWLGCMDLPVHSNAKPPIVGLDSKPSARKSSHFCADAQLGDGVRLLLQAPNQSHGVRKVPDGQAFRYTLKVVHTAGHAANHVCLVLEEDGLLFSGDHVLSTSTPVIDPPDGDLGVYLQSLAKLENVCQAHKVCFILPAHGYAMGESPDDDCSVKSILQALKAHRLKRHEKVLKALQQKPFGDVWALLPLVYDDVPASRWGAAKRSLLAHMHYAQTQMQGKTDKT